jgi:hypothetical protein
MPGLRKSAHYGVNVCGGVDSPGLRFARPPSSSRSAERGMTVKQKIVICEKPSFPLAEERVDERSDVGVSQRKRSPAIILSPFPRIFFCIFISFFPAL